MGCLALLAPSAGSDAHARFASIPAATARLLKNSWFFNRRNSFGCKLIDVFCNKPAQAQGRDCPRGAAAVIFDWVALRFSPPPGAPMLTHASRRPPPMFDFYFFCFLRPPLGAAVIFDWVALRFSPPPGAPMLTHASRRSPPLVDFYVFAFLRPPTGDRGDF